jgi:hypothetical protein
MMMLPRLMFRKGRSSSSSCHLHRIASFSKSWPEDCRVLDGYPHSFSASRRVLSVSISRARRFEWSSDLRQVPAPGWER